MRGERSSRLLAIQENIPFGELEKYSLSVGHRGGAWGIFDSGLAQYSDTFEQVSQPGFRRALAKTVEQGGRKSILDLMASESAVHEAVERGFAYGLAVSLGFEQTRYPQVNGGHIDVLNGDILSYRTWLGIEERMQKAGFSEGFDVIVSRPEGGLGYLTDSEFVHFWLLQHAWKLLNPNNGQMYLQAPSLTWMSGTLDYLEALKKKCGIISKWDRELDRVYGYAFYLQKNPDSPKRLPSPKALGL